jgi:DNA polymerase III delta subunit
MATRKSSKPAAGAAASAPAARPRTTRAAAPKVRATAPADPLALLERAERGDTPASLYIDGPDEALKAAFLASFRRGWAANVPEAPAARVMRPGEDDVDAILAAYHGMSMFTPRELTIVLDVEDMAKSEKRVAALAAGVARPAGASCLVLVESAGDNVRKTLEPLRAACAVRWVAEPLEFVGLLAWGRRRLTAAGLQAEPGALERLIEVCEGEAAAFFSELGKLEGWSAAAGKVTKADVEALSRPVVGTDLEAYLEAVAAGQAGVAAKRLGRLIAAGENEGGVLWALGHVVGTAIGGGWGKWKPISATLSRRRSRRELASALDAVYRAEAAWKGGRTDALTALEQATREVAGR